jgi:ADP-dependent phosphofructokinase/glucokinase
MLVGGRTKLKHIRQDYWINLSRLIPEDRKLKEAKRLKEIRTHVKMSSMVDRNEEDITTNLVRSKLSSIGVNRI